MKLMINDQSLIVVKDCDKEDVTTVRVDQVEFARDKSNFYNITNNNINNYEVEIAPTDSVYLELDITSGKAVKDVCVMVTNKQGEQDVIQFSPRIRMK